MCGQRLKSSREVRVIRRARILYFLLTVLAVSMICRGVQTPARTRQTKKSRTTPQKQKRGSGLNAYKLGTFVRDYYDIKPMRPMNKAHLNWGEYKCKMYGPQHNIRLGDFTIPNDNVHLVFYKDRLMRIRVINPFSGKTGKNLVFFTSMLAALTQKYGPVKSSVPIYSRYDGKYRWQKGKTRITLEYARLEYALVSLEAKLKKAIKKGTKISISDI